MWFEPGAPAFQIPDLFIILQLIPAQMAPIPSPHPGAPAPHLP
jgi:hypothetical protein